ncbi:histidine kinase [Paenibacillus sp. F411]|uniref:cache domain-containing sensor histidine kinase n=1 Tax=Paenibacillus sp. F411 TaxID=2820239 RepID=UPI0015863FA1|nr:cache domain-containing protein [Paenibacillus sp. F411]MBO2945245.1 histidine kinase [Paenibacillus sp. F411]
MSKLSIRMKMVIGFMSISLIAVTLMAVFAHNNYSSATKQDFYSIAEQAVTRTNYQMDLYFSQLEQSTYTTIAGPITSGVSLNSHESGLIQKWLSKNNSLTKADTRTIENILNKYIALNYSEIAGMFLVSNEGDLISSTGTTISIEHVINEPWFSSSDSKESKIIPTYYTNYNSSRKDTAMISLIIPIYSVDTVKQSGKLIISLKLSEIINILGQTQLGETGYVFVVAEDGTIVFHPNASWIGQNIKDTSLHQLDFTATRSIQWLNEEEHLISYHESEQTGWKVIAFVPFHEMASGLMIARNSTLLVAIILFVLIMVLVPVLSNGLLQPIIQLKNLMLRVQNGDLKARAEYIQGADEMQVLNLTFNKMAGNLDELINTVTDLRIREVQLQLKQKEALVQVLQNQINPHLLYNTLDIIKSIAYLEDVPMIEKMCANLASIYRYTAQLSKLEVELNEELDHVRKYLEIIHVRFTLHFQSEIYVNEKFLGARIVNFTIQPIVENAIKYAVEPLKGKAAVIISAYIEQDDLIIEIADNGPGMTACMLEDLNQKLQDITHSGLDKLTAADTVGLINVHTRIVLQYGREYGLSLTSFPERGTIVSMRIPFVDQGDERNISQ